MRPLVTRLSALSLCGLTVAACTDPSSSISAKSDARTVVIEVYGATTEDGQKSGRYIDGVAPKGSHLSAHDDLAIADAALACGSPTVTVNRSYSHVAYVSFPSASSFNNDGFIRPSDFEIIKCVQRRVSVPFRPGIADTDEGIVGADFSPFQALGTQ